ncbi:MAG: hypothetical protein KGZ75_04570 [Syntrophomonadaceae bacterium]|nr:hypothetical protein [Syntrophomonadaceae bacterium]
MASLVRIDTAMIAKTVIPILREFQDVAGAFHFGSSLGMCRPDSDIDIALVCIPLEPCREREYERLTNQIINRLSPVDGHPFDLVVLNSLPDIIAFRIIKNGNLIYRNDPGTVGDFIEKVSRRYGENYPRYQEAVRLIVGV